MFWWVFGIIFVLVALILLLGHGFANHMSSGPTYRPNWLVILGIAAAIAFLVALVFQGAAALI